MCDKLTITLLQFENILGTSNLHITAKRSHHTINGEQPVRKYYIIDLGTPHCHALNLISAIL